MATFKVGDKVNIDGKEATVVAVGNGIKPFLKVDIDGTVVSVRATNVTKV
jgi:hypothetical protein